MLKKEKKNRSIYRLQVYEIKNSKILFFIFLTHQTDRIFEGKNKKCDILLFFYPIALYQINQKISKKYHLFSISTRKNKIWITTHKNGQTKTSDTDIT